MIEVRDVREFMEKRALELPPFEQTIKNPKNEDGSAFPGHERVAYSQGFPKIKMSQKIKTRGDGEKEYEPIEKNYAFPKEAPPDTPNMAWRRGLSDLNRKPKQEQQQNGSPRISNSPNYQLVRKWMKEKSENQPIVTASIAGSVR